MSQIFPVDRAAPPGRGMPAAAAGPDPVADGRVLREIRDLLTQLVAGQRAVLDALAPAGASPRLEGGQRKQPAAIREDLLATIFALLGDGDWTVEELLEEAWLGTSAEHARVRATLGEMGIKANDRRKLGSCLRSGNGARAGGLELRQHECNRDGVRRWSVARTV